MKTAIKLVLLYFAAQIAAMLIATIGGVVYSLAIYGDMEHAVGVALVPAMLLGFLFMALYLWYAGYIPKEKVAWSAVSPKYLVFTAIMYFATVVVLDYIVSLMPWLPNIMEDSFDAILTSWPGILSIAVLGPVLEELLFRGAITKALLEKYEPGKAILFSALIFGIFHINPAQVVVGALMGLLLAWLYYKTASLIPCLLVHILHNSLSVYLTLNHPDKEQIADFFPGASHYILIAVSLLVIAGMYMAMRKTTIPYPWRKEKEAEGQTIV